jgi:hypothetical protein
MQKNLKTSVPLNDAIIIALARLVDDAQTEKRQPTHSEIEFYIDQTNLTDGDPARQGQTVGKAKRVRGALSWALEHAEENAETFAASLLMLVRGKGGFRQGSPNFVGEDAILDATEAFRAEGYVLSANGELHPTSIDTLAGTELTKALEAYVRRARRGSEDAALLVGTGKDLLEATAAHIMHERYGQYPHHANFPTLLGQVFNLLGLATQPSNTTRGESPQSRLQRALYEAGCAINSLRNKEGTGHGRPWQANVSETEAHAAVQLMGIISGLLLNTQKTAP